MESQLTACFSSIIRHSLLRGAVITHHSTGLSSTTESSENYAVLDRTMNMSNLEENGTHIYLNGKNDQTFGSVMTAERT